MTRILVAMAMLWTATASADSRISLSIERDNLLPLVERPEPVVVQPRPDIDMLATVAEHRRDRLWQAIDIATLVASTAALGCDWGQTHAAAAAHWRGGPTGRRIEANPLMGLQPSTATVNSYFAISAAANVALWVALPKRWRSIIPAMTTVAEIVLVRSNSNLNSMGLCGISQ